MIKEILLAVGTVWALSAPAEGLGAEPIQKASEITKMQEWIDQPDNYYLLLDEIESPDDIDWENALEGINRYKLIGKPLADESQEMIDDYLKLSERDELKEYVSVVTNEEIEEFTSLKTGKSYDLTITDPDKYDQYWYWSDQYDVWYCDSSFMRSIRYEYHGMPEYNFKILDVTEDGDDLICHARTYAISDIHEVKLEIKLHKAADGYQIVSSIADWEENAVKIEQADIPEYGGQVDMVVYDDQHIYRDDIKVPYDFKSTTLAIVKDNKVLENIMVYDYGEQYKPIAVDTIDDILVTDFDKNGHTDLIVTMTNQDGTYNCQILTWQMERVSEVEGFMDFGYAAEHIEETLDKPSAQEIVDYLTEGAQDKFADYKQAFQYQVKLLSDMYGDDLSYGLVYLDGDDIPELTAGNSGYSVSLYQYLDGQVYQLIDCWPYGAGGNSGYCYYRKTGVIYNHNQDHAGAEHYDSYAVLDPDTHQIDWTMYEHSFLDELPEDFEEDLSTAGFYMKVDGEYQKVSESKFNQKLASYGVDPSQRYDDEQFGFLSGRMSKDEILEELK